MVSDYACTRKSSRYNYGNSKRKTNLECFDEGAKCNLTDNESIRVCNTLYIYNLPKYNSYITIYWFLRRDLLSEFYGCSPFR